MEETNAIRAAIGLMRVPSRLRQFRSQSLPEGVETLLRVAAGDREAERDAAAATGASPADIQNAAAFFIEQVLLAPDSDHYRALGASPNATNAELRRNMALLLKGMHPDIEDGVRSLFAHRVINAWSALKTPERRAAYDENARGLPATPQFSKKIRRSHRRKRQKQTLQKPPSHTSNRTSLAHYRSPQKGFFYRLLRMLLTGVRA